MGWGGEIKPDNGRGPIVLWVLTNVLTPSSPVSLGPGGLQGPNLCPRDRLFLLFIRPVKNTWCRECIRKLKMSLDYLHP